MNFDLHVHTKYSPDAITTPETLLKTAEGKGIGFAITDHDSIGAWKDLKFLEKKYPSVPVIYGEEVSSVDDKGKNAGHIIGLFLSEGIKAKHYLEVLDDIKSQGAISVIAHPFDVYRVPCNHLNEIKKKIDLVEVFNSRCYSLDFNSKALSFAKEKNLCISAGSDSHTPEELGMALVEAKAVSAEGLRKELLKGSVIAAGKLSGITPHLKTNLRMLGLLGEV